MSEFNNCLICGTKYKYCPHCRQYNPNESWRGEYCSENCREIFNTCSAYVGKSITIAEAYSRLSKLNIPTNILPKGVSRNIIEIMSYTPKKATQKKIDVVDDAKVYEEEQPKRTRKRRVKRTES